MSALERLSRPPIEPIYLQTSPNEEITLATTELKFTKGDKTTDVTAKARIRFVPDDRLEFVWPMEGDAFPFDLGSVDVEKFTLKASGQTFNALFAELNGERREVVLHPTLSGITISKPANAITSAVFHLFNFPDFFGGQDYTLTKGDPPYQGWKRCGRAVLNGDGWTITIAALDRTDELVKLLKGHGGFVITHMGRVARDDGSPFSSEQLSDILSCLHYFLSFALGRWAGLALPVGFDARGNRVFEEWGLRMSADGAWNGAYSWFDEHNGELLSQVFPGFVALWKNKDWRTPLAHALYWYLGSCQRGTGIGVDTGIILAQTALELLAWNYCVIDRKIVPRTQFQRGGLSAPNKLRRLVSELGIPPEIPAGLSVVPRKSGKKWDDSMHLITGIRNALVHPDSQTTLPDQPFFEGWKLSLWYIDMVLLRLCGHVGNYANRLLHQRWVGTVESVPWVKSK
jgi:hypothetical protein